MTALPDRAIALLRAALSDRPWSKLGEIIAIFGGLNLLWEVAQLPLYSIWYEASPGTIAFAVFHCTAGDVLIGANSAIVAILLAAILFSSAPPPAWATGALFLLISQAYTAYSEWLNVFVRKSWSYSVLMPTMPPLQTGLSPMLQWIVVPALTVWIVRSRWANH
jgi:hypothetical protein